MQASANSDAAYQVTGRGAAIVFSILTLFTLACVVTAFASYRRQQKEYNELQTVRATGSTTASMHGMELATGSLNSAQGRSKTGGVTSPLRSGPLSTAWDPGEQEKGHGFQNVPLS